MSATTARYGGLPKKKRCKRFTLEDRKTQLYVANIAAAVLHFVWAAVFLSLWAFNKREDGSRRDISYPLYSSHTSWLNDERNVTASYSLEDDNEQCEAPRGIRFGTEMEVLPVWKDSGVRLSLHWLIWSFFLLSCAFQILLVLNSRVKTRRKLVSNAIIRFGEYSVTASLMIVAIGLQLGIFSAQVLVLLAALTASTMVTGVLAEMLTDAVNNVPKSEENKNESIEDTKSVELEFIPKEFEEMLRTCRRAAWAAHFLGWFLQVVVWGLTLIPNFLGSQRTCGSPGSAPWQVHLIVGGEAFLFTCFGLVQLLYIAGVFGIETTEIWYTTLSFVSKTFLGWVIYGSNFVD